MTKKMLMISTCGTSLLTNGVDSKTKSLVFANANYQKDEIPEQIRKEIEKIIGERKLHMEEADISTVRSMSAELNGVIGYLNGDLSKAKEDMFFFIHTDTWEGEKCAEVICEWLMGKGISANLLKIEGLNTRDAASFKRGVAKIAKWCHETLPGFKEDGYKVVFNLSGGFKSFQGFMQALGMVFADESIYIFENASELISIPKIPFNLDDSLYAAIKEHLPLFRKLMVSDILPIKECENLPEILIESDEDYCCLSAWGEVVLGLFKEKYYYQEIFPSPSDKIIYDPKKIMDLLKKDKRRVRDFNERMDDLFFYLSVGVNKNRLDFKKLKVGRVGKSDHEMDLSSDKGAWRIFGYFRDDGAFVIEHVGESEFH
ncbi:MAG: putative CRISPR-associated protein [Thermotogaceae bacterium]|nr:putative CRISPR-associated protein [Thermotogaceae bacterium]